MTRPFWPYGRVHDVLGFHFASLSGLPRLGRRSPATTPETIGPRQRPETEVPLPPLKTLLGKVLGGSAQATPTKRCRYDLDSSISRAISYDALRPLSTLSFRNDRSSGGLERVKNPLQSHGSVGQLHTRFRTLERDDRRSGAFSRQLWTFVAGGGWLGAEINRPISATRLASQKCREKTLQIFACDSLDTVPDVFEMADVSILSMGEHP